MTTSVFLASLTSAMLLCPQIVVFNLSIMPSWPIKNRIQLVINWLCPFKTMTSHWHQPGSNNQFCFQRWTASNWQLSEYFQRSSYSSSKFFSRPPFKMEIRVSLHLLSCSSSTSLAPFFFLCFSLAIEMKWNSTAAGSGSTRCAWTIKRVIVIESHPLETE